MMVDISYTEDPFAADHVGATGMDIFGPRFAQVCFGVSSLKLENSGWYGVWIAYAIFIQYLPILASLGFFFLYLISRSTLVHFLANTSFFTWVINASLEYYFHVSPRNRECIATLRAADLQLIGPVYAMPPLEVTQSVALSLFFTFYVFFWHRQWFLDIQSDQTGFYTIQEEAKENRPTMLFFVLLLIQNPLLLWIRHVYTFFEIAVAIILGIFAATNVVLVYMFLMWSYNMNRVYVVTTLSADVGKLAAPFANPFTMLYWPFWNQEKESK
jgi:hypothetical protein